MRETAAIPGSYIPWSAEANDTLPGYEAVLPPGASATPDAHSDLAAPYAPDAPDAAVPATAADIFGPESILHTTAEIKPGKLDRHPIVNNYVYEGFVLALFVLLCYITYAYRSSIQKLFKEGLRDKIFDEHPLVFRQFMTYGSLLALILCSTMTVKFIDYFNLMAGVLDPLPIWMQSMLTPAFIIVFAVYAVYRRFLSKVIGKVVIKEAFFEQYVFLSRVSLLVFAFAVAPFFIVFSMIEGADYQWIEWAILIVVAVAYAIYLARSYYFFNTRDVSILQWFLYLCAVEFLPLSFVLIATLRYS